MCVFSKGACFGNCSSSLDRLRRKREMESDRLSYFFPGSCEALQLPPDRHPTNCRKLYFLFSDFPRDRLFFALSKRGEIEASSLNSLEKYSFYRRIFLCATKAAIFLSFLLLCFYVHHFESDPVHQHLLSFPRIKSRGEGIEK